MVGSSYVYKATSEQLTSSENKLKATKAELKKVSSLYDEVNSGISSVKIENPQPAEPVLDLYTKFGYDLKAKVPEFGVKVTFAKVQGYTGGDTDLASVPQPFNVAKQLKVLTVSIDGKYTEYENFKKFLSWINTRPISISSLTVNGDTFNLVVDLYGE